MNHFYKHPLLWGLGGVLLSLSANAQVKVGDNPTTLAPNTTFQVEKGGSSMVVSNTGWVGIGTTTPQAKLHVENGGVFMTGGNHVLQDNDAASTGNYSLGYQASSATNNPIAQPYLLLLRGRGSRSNIGHPRVGDLMGEISFREPLAPLLGGAGISAVAMEDFSPTAKGTRLNVYTTPVGSTTALTRMTVNHDGYVGIGTSNPEHRLHLNSGIMKISNSLSGGLLAEASGENDPNAHPWVLFSRGRGSLGNLARSQAGDMLGAVFGRDALDLTSGLNYGGVLYFQATETQGLSNHGTRIRLNVNANGQPSTNTAVIIDHNSNVAIGDFIPTEKLHVSGNVLASAYNIPSDRRYKQNIQPLVGTLGKLGQVRGVSYTHTEQAIKDRSLAKGLQIGFIAQELEAIFPEFVITSADGYKAVDYARLTPVLVEAIKELTQKNGELSARVNELEGLKTEMASIKALLQQSMITTTPLNTGK